MNETITDGTTTIGFIFVVGCYLLLFLAITISVYVYIKTSFKKYVNKGKIEEETALKKENKKNNIEMHIGYVIPLYLELKTIEEKTNKLLKDKNIKISEDNSYFIADGHLFNKNNCHKYEIENYDQSVVSIINDSQINTRIVFDKNNKISEEEFVRIFTKLLIRNCEWHVIKNRK